MTLRRITLMLGALLLATLAGSAFAQSNAARSGSESTGKGGTSKDAMFMRHAAADSLAEIQMGRIALDKSSSAQVKELAQRIIDDHTKANDQLMSIAQRKQVTLPTEPMPMQKQEADKLKAMSGKAFDEAYAKAMVKDHRKAIKMFGMENQEAADSDVKEFASTTLPVLKTHLQMAEQIAGGSMHHSMNHTGTPMDNNGSMGMPASGSSTH
jgi:putative membrane protein